MLKMLERTRRLQCIIKISTILRVILFFGIPSVYFMFSESNKDYQDEDTLSDYRHFTSRHLFGIVENNVSNCTPPAVLDFPSDGFTRFQRKHGFIVIHCVLAIYCFMMLGVICEQYFVPTVKLLCERLQLAEDITGATLMAMASSSPELFVNAVGTFVSESDLGVGAIVGSAVFNLLAVPACCGLIAKKVIELDWWSVSRDCLMYAISVVVLILVMLDDKIYWYEALLLVLLYTLYILALVFNGKLESVAKSGCCTWKKSEMYTEITPLLIKEKSQVLDISEHHIIYANNNNNDLETGLEREKTQNFSVSDSSTNSPWLYPNKESSLPEKIFLFLTLPTNFLLWITIPDCRRHQRLYVVTFAMCIIWIGGISYVVTWIITIIGDTLDVPDSVTGLTILAAGTSLPEAVSSVLVTNQGHGGMGISNSIGSNTFDILLCLGLPWLVKSVFYPAVPGNYWVPINSSGLSYNAISLLSTVFTLYGCLALNKFLLDWKIGVVCLLVYVGFLILAVLIELNVFSIMNLPICPH